MEKFKRIWFLILLAVLFLPMMQTCFHLVDERPLDGVAKKAKKPVVNRQTLYNEMAQDSLLKWCTEQTGFRNTMIRVNNQLLFSVYGKVPNTGIVRSKDRNNYFGTRYVLSYTGESFLGEEEIQKRVRRLKVAQDILLTKGVTVVSVFTLGKASYYSELIPDKYLAKGRETNNYNAFLEAFAEQGINVIDFNRYLCDRKDTEIYPYYSNLSTHWTAYAASLAMDSLVHYMESKTKKTHVHAVIESFDTTWILQQDDEMSRNMNLIFPLEHNTIYEPVFSFTEGYKPKVLAIADSYWWTVFNKKVNLPQTLFSNTGFWFYNNTINTERSSQKTVEELDYKKEIESQEFVLLVGTEASLDKWPYSFPERYLSAYDNVFRHKSVDQYDAADSLYLVFRNAEIKNTIQRIKESPQWLENVTNSAKEKGIDMETALWNAADYTYRTVMKPK
jgi:hypothetical protein